MLNSKIRRKQLCQKETHDYISHQKHKQSSQQDFFPYQNNNNNPKPNPHNHPNQKYTNPEQSNISIKQYKQPFIQVERSANHFQVNQLSKTTKPFQDSSFPPNQQSLVGQFGYQSKFKFIQWKRITDLIKNPKIITNQIQPSDIKQGLVGDCYFLAAIAALAQRPVRIKKLFSSQVISPNKHFQVKMLYQGKWVKIDLDQWFPTQRGKQLAFTKAVQGQLWAVILQKAWAKLYTNYMRIEGGFPQQVLHDLSGAPCKTVMLNRHVKQQTWKYLWDSSLKQYSMVAASNSGSDRNLSYAGIAQGHAYTLLNAIYLNIENRYQKVVQLRNPWGQIQSKIGLSDNDLIWNKVTQNEKKRVGYYKKEYQNDYNDGIFFMYYEDFVKEFNWVQVAEIQDNANYICLSKKDPGLKGVYFNLRVFKKGTYSLQIDKPPMRGYPQKIQRYYSYPLAQLVIKEKNGKMKKSTQNYSSERMLFFKQQLDVGNYIVKCLIHYDRKIEKDYHVNLAVYSQNKCQLKWASTQQAEDLQGRRVQWSGNNGNLEQEELKDDWHQGGNIDFLKQKKKWIFKEF